MPSLPTRAQQPSPVAPQVELPAEFPDIPAEVLERFPSARQWQRDLDEFWTRTKQSIQTAQTQAANYANARVVYSVDTFLIYAKNGIPEPMFALDSTGVKLGDVLVINTPGRKMYIGEGVYADDGTPFYVDTLGFFSLGSSLTWNPETDTLDITGVINATSGTIGGFEIGSDYIRDSNNSFGLASTVTGGDDVRFWAGDTFANRATAPFRVTEDGLIFANNTSFVNVVNTGTLRLIAASSGFSPLILASSGFVESAATPAYGLTFSSGFSLRATSNGANLICERINPTYEKQSYTNIFASGLSIALNLSSGAGTIANAYGIYIESVNIGTANWGLYVATTARNYMAGDLTVASIGATTPGTGAFTTVTSTGNLTVGTAAGTPAVALGGTTSSYPAIRFDAANQLGVVLADQSAYANLKALGGEFSSMLVSGLAGVGTRAVVADASGNLSAP